jgi:uncharacterized membrane protein YkvI
LLISAENRPHWRDVLTFGGAIMAFVIGAGFASGQEVMQFFTHLGLWRSLAAGGVALSLFVWFSATVLEDARQLQLDDANKIFAHYCGKHIGLFFEWFVPALLFLAVSIMLAGAGATVSEHYGINPDIGRFGMALATLATVLLGLKRLVQIIGALGPALILVTIVVGLVSIAQNPAGIARANAVLKTIDVPGASSNWFLSGVLYASFSLNGLMAFMAGMGKQARNRWDTALGGTFGGAMFVIGAMVLSTGLLANISEVYDKQIPSLVIANRIFPLMASVFAILLLASIYTTAVPCLWVACNRVSTDERSWRYRVSAVAMVLISCFGAQLQFGKMVGVVYPISGYLGLILIAGMIYTKYHRKRGPWQATAARQGR